MNNKIVKTFKDYEMKTKIIITFTLLLIIPLTINAQNNFFDYFGQNPPGDSAIIFAPGIISLNDRLEGKIAFSPDGSECYFTVWGASYSSCKIYYTKRINNTWTEQVEAPFSTGQYCGEPFLSADGSRLYFNYSYRDKPTNIWMVERTTKGWDDPRELPSPINSDRWDANYSESAENTIYIASNRSGGFDERGDIWRIIKTSDQPNAAENLGTSVNSIAWESGIIAPDGSYLIFTSERPGGIGRSDLYVTFKKEDNSWTAPVNLKSINIGDIASTTDPSISPDGRFLFFVRYNRTNAGETRDIYWVSTKIIEDIKNKCFK